MKKIQIKKYIVFYCNICYDFIVTKKLSLIISKLSDINIFINSSFIYSKYSFLIIPNINNTIYRIIINFQFITLNHIYAISFSVSIGILPLNTYLFIQSLKFLSG